MAKINFYLRDKNSDEPTPIIMTLSVNDSRVKFSTGESIKPVFWNPNEQRPRSTAKFPEHPEFRRRLDNMETAINKIIFNYQATENGEYPPPHVLREKWQEYLGKNAANQKTDNFWSYLDRFIDELKSRISEKTGKPFSYHTIKGYVSLKNVLLEFSKTNRTYKQLDFKDFDLDFYFDFQAYLAETKNMALNTIGSRIKNLKAVLNHAYENEVNSNLSFKKKKFKVTKEQTEAVYLSIEELNILESLDLSNNKTLDRVRDLFLVGCWTGVRFSDLKQINTEAIKTDNQGAFIEITAQKTDNPVVIPVLPVVQRVIDKYHGDLPKVISNQKMNQYLKEVGKLAGLNSKESKTLTKGGLKVTSTKEKFEVLTTHTARRSFCTNNYLAGMPVISIMAISGHKTEKEFLRYIKLTPREHANKLRELWNEHQQGKVIKFGA